MVNKEIKEEIKRYLGMNENEDTRIQNLWDTGKAILTGKFIALQGYLKQTNKQTNKQKKIKNKHQEKPQISYLIC